MKLPSSLVTTCMLAKVASAAAIGAVEFALFKLLLFRVWGYMSADSVGNGSALHAQVRLASRSVAFTLIAGALTADGEATQ